MTVAENPNREGMLFAGTGNGFFYSMDDGATWTQFKDGLPAAPVTWIAPQPLYHDDVVSTYGRGLFILRDITRLEQADRVPSDAEAHLYEPRGGIREARSGSAELLYSLATTPSANVEFEILDARGAVIRSFEAVGRAGLNRATWDLSYQGPEQVALRTVPPDNPHIWEEGRFKDEDTRPIIHWGIGRPQRSGPIAAPGSYTARMIVDGKRYEQPFEVVKDPAIPSSDADLVASTELQIAIRDRMNETADMINRLEIMRKQIEDHIAAHEDDGEAVRALEELDTKMMDVELQLLSRTDMHSDDKWYVEAYEVYMQLIWLNAEVGLGAGDVQGGAEYRPTDAAVEWFRTIEAELAPASFDYPSISESCRTASSPFWTTSFSASASSSREAASCPRLV